MTTYLLDANVLSLPMKPAPKSVLLRRFEQIEPSSFVASTALCELRFGVLRLPNGRRRDDLIDYLEAYLSGHAVLEYDRAAAEWHAAERVRLERLGQTPPFADGQIAAVAAVNELTLVTLNPRDFERFEGVRIESWATG